MYFYDAIHKIAAENNFSMEQVSLDAGRSISFISASKSRRSDPKVDTAAMIAGVVGYKLCLIPENNVPDDAIVIG